MGQLTTTLICALLIALVVGFSLFMASFQAASIVFITICVVVVAAILFHAIFEVVAVVGDEDYER